MSINFRLLFRNLKTLIITVFVIQILSVGIYHLYSYFFDDYVSKAKIVSFCFDSSNSCELISDNSNNKNLTDYVKDNEILEDVVNSIESSTGMFLSVTDVKNSITVQNMNGYLLLKIDSNNSFLTSIIYENLISKVFEKTNLDDLRYSVVEYSIYEVLSLSFIKQIGFLISLFLAFFIIFSSTKKVSKSNLSFLGGIALAKNKFKQNILITLVTISIFILVGSGIYFGHKVLYKSYKIESKYTFVCNNPDTCDFDDVNELYNALKSYTSKNSTVTSIIDQISKTSQIHLSTQDIEKSIDLKLSNDVIVLIVSNKNTLTATYINDTLTNKVFNEIEIQEEINLRQLDSDFNESPDYTSYLLISTTLGSLTALLLIGSELSIKKSKKATSKVAEK